MNKKAFADLVQRTLNTELRGVQAAVEAVSDQMEAATEIMANTRGKVIVIGVGKSGLVGQKIAATLSSTGTAASFLHPVEALHGDLGMVQEFDSALVLSNSGSSGEIAQLIPRLRQKQVPVVSITGHIDSFLGRKSDVVLCTGVLEEACPLGLAPTTSTTAALVIGDILAVALMEVRGFGREDFAERHPAGSLGQELVTVPSLMRKVDAVAQVAKSESLSEVARAINAMGAGVAAVLEDGRLVGCVSDGDLRRGLARCAENGDSADTLTAGDCMSHAPKVIGTRASAKDALAMFEQFRITVLFVATANGTLKGSLHLHDVLAALHMEDESL